MKPELLNVTCIIKNEFFIWRFLPSERRRTIMHIAATALDDRFPFNTDNFEEMADGIDCLCKIHKEATK